MLVHSGNPSFGGNGIHVPVTDRGDGGNTPPDGIHNRLVFCFSGPGCKIVSPNRWRFDIIPTLKTGAIQINNLCELAGQPAPAQRSATAGNGLICPARCP